MAAQAGDQAPATATPKPPALSKVPGAKARNVVFILADDHRYDAMGFMGHPIVKTPSMDRIAQSGVAPAERVRHDRAVLAEPGEHPDGALRAPAQGRGQQLAGAAGHDVLPAVPAAGGLPDRVLRQVAHGQRRWRAAAGVRPVGELQGAGHVPADARRPQRRRQEGAAEGLHHRRADRLHARVAEGARQVAAVLRVPVPQGRAPGLRAGGAPQGHARDAAPAAAEEPDLSRPSRRRCVRAGCATSATAGTASTTPYNTKLDIAAVLPAATPRRCAAWTTASGACSTT